MRDMKSEDIDFELIEKYLDNDLSDSERGTLLERLDQDANLRKVLLDMEKLVGGIKYAGRTQMLNHFNELEQGLPALDFGKAKKKNEETKIISIKGGSQQGVLRWAYIGIAASILLVAMAAIFVLNNNWSTQPEYLSFAEQQISRHYPYLSPNNVRGTEQELDDRELAFGAYNARNYVEAVEMFDKLLESEQDAELLFYSAQANLSAGNFEKAIRLYDDLLTNPGNYERRAIWFKALALVELGETVSAKSALKQLLTDDNDQLERNARELLDMLQP